MDSSRGPGQVAPVVAAPQRKAKPTRRERKPRPTRRYGSGIAGRCAARAAFVLAFDGPHLLGGACQSCVAPRAGPWHTEHRTSAIPISRVAPCPADRPSCAGHVLGQRAGLRGRPRSCRPRRRPETERPRPRRSPSKSAPRHHLRLVYPHHVYRPDQARRQERRRGRNSRTGRECHLPHSVLLVAD